MSINRYLEETASKLIIKGNEKESIDVSLNTFKDIVAQLSRQKSKIFIMN